MVSKNVVKRFSFTLLMDDCRIIRFFHSTWIFNRMKEKIWIFNFSSCFHKLSKILVWVTSLQHLSVCRPVVHYCCCDTCCISRLFFVFFFAGSAQHRGFLFRCQRQPATVASRLVTLRSAKWQHCSNCVEIYSVVLCNPVPLFVRQLFCWSVRNLLKRTVQWKTIEKKVKK